MKFVQPSHLTDPDATARKLVEIAHTIEAVQDGRIHIELINIAFLRLAARRLNSALASDARSPRAGCGGMKAEPM
jgi:hypothetical protein